MVNARDIAGRTPLHLTTLNKRRAIAKLLIARGAKTDAKDKNGETPIDYWPELAEIVKKVEAEKAAKGQP